MSCDRFFFSLIFLIGSYFSSVWGHVPLDFCCLMHPCSKITISLFRSSPVNLEVNVIPPDSSQSTYIYNRSASLATVGTNDPFLFPFLGLAGEIILSSISTKYQSRSPFQGQIIFRSVLSLSSISIVFLYYFGRPRIKAVRNWKWRPHFLGWYKSQSTTWDCGRYL